MSRGGAATALAAYVLHRYDWSESSLIVDLFTRELGRVVVAAKGAKRPTSQLRAVLRPFQRLHATLGRTAAGAEVHNLRGAEWAGGVPLVGGEALFSGFYLNELLMKLLAREDPHPALWDAYAAKFSIPYAIAVALLHDDAGLAEYADDQVRDPALLALAAKVAYRIDPANPYPRQFTGHLQVTLADGSVHAHRQAYFKGGAEHPLSNADLEHKFFANCAHGGMARANAQRLRAALGALFDRPRIDADALPS